MTPQATLKLVDLMTEAGYVDRTDSPEDRRVRLVVVNDRGREALATAQAFHDRFESDLATSIGGEAAAGVRRGLELLAARTPVAVPGGNGRPPR
ncbi:MarR family winged helix-turn-helix transcriptional regulator [Nocardioides sambongensis]|uniref:MarR family winged helix-turn-helix transcriptional regulator n=1 Tax=Nocardioides sambongensis TaxID=2589074 RepID=UPI001127C572|nr:hypothetical protein [Nocardioides sambongensis]